MTGRLFFLYSWSQKVLITSHCIFPGFNCGDSRTREAKGWTWNCIEEGVFLYLPVIYLSYTQKNIMYREIQWCCYPIIKLQLAHLSFSCFYLSISTTVILRVCLCVCEWISSVSTTSYVLQHQSQRFFKFFGIIFSGYFFGFVYGIRSTPHWLPLVHASVMPRKKESSLMKQIIRFLCTSNQRYFCFWSLKELRLCILRIYYSYSDFSWKI